MTTTVRRNVLAWFCVEAICLGPFGSTFAQNKMVGYYASWHASILPSSDVQYSNLSHILVAFSFPNADGTLTHDLGIPFTAMVEAAHGQGCKVLISLGGAGSSSNFPPATADSAIRSVLISNIISFLQANDYDGVDLDWETPANAAETAQLTAFVKEMRAGFNQINSSWVMTMAVPPTNWGGQHFDFANLVNSIDWFNVMCYDFYGSWSGFAGHDSPLYQSPDDPNQAGSDSAAIVYMSSRGVPHSKLVLGIPFYGVQFSAPGLYRATTISTTSNPYYPDVLRYLTSGWAYHWDSIAKVPYLLNSDSTQFVTFEDTISVRLKREFAVRQGLGGLMCWELAQDVLPDGSQPLLNVIAGAFQRSTGIAGARIDPGSFILHDNYPNPFNPTTTIQFELPERGNVRIEVVDVLGQRIILSDMGVLDRGTHRQVFDLSSQPSGVYFYRLGFHGSQTAVSITKKMILVK